MKDHLISIMVHVSIIGLLAGCAASPRVPDDNAVSTSGNGIFTGVRFIQRLHTVGGNAPSDGCDQASAGKEVRVSYSAESLFYVDKP